MLDDADRSMLAWVASVPDVPPVVLHPTKQQPGDKAVGLRLLDIASTPPQRNAHQSVWQFRLRYLVTASAPDALETHAILGKLLLAATIREDWEIDSVPPSLELWRALGLEPQPSFVIAVRWRHEVGAPRVGRVVHPLTVEHRRMADLKGRVVGPGDIGIMSARVEITALGLSTMTDAEGRFRFPGAPQGAPLDLRISARGTVVEQSSTTDLDPDGNVLVRLALE